MGTPGLRPGARRSRRGRDLRELVAARRPVRPPALRGGRGGLRGRGAARQGRGGPGEPAGAPTRPLVCRPACARGGGPRVPRGAPGGARRGGCGDRRGGPLHVHLHVGHDRAAEGVHDPPPQLLRDGRCDRRTARPQPTWRCDAPVPPARAQLRAADAPLRAVRRLHDRVPAGAARRRPRDPRGAADDPAERPARVREGAHRRDDIVRRGHRGEAAADRLGARRRPAGERAPPRGTEAAARTRDPAPPRRAPGVLEGERASRRTAPAPDLGWRAAREGDRRALRRNGHLHHGGLRPDRVHDRRDDEPSGGAIASGRSGRRSRGSSCASRTTASC